MDNKPCSVCHEVKPLDQFNKAGANRLQSRCKGCQSNMHRKWREGHRQHRSKYQRQWARENVVSVRAKNKKWYEANKDKMASLDRMRRYGLTQRQYDAMLASQGGKCAICPATEPKGRGRWHVDHDHKTGVVRALLCNGCNLGVGHFRDDPALLRAAADYLERPLAI